MRERTEIRQLNCRVTIIVCGVPQSHATPYIPLFQPSLYYPLLSCLPRMYKKGTPRLKGGVLTEIICCFEHYWCYSSFYLWTLYLLLASFYVGFLYILVQNLTILFLPITQKTMYKTRGTGYKMTKSA